MAVKTGDSVWVVGTEHGVKLYTCEKYARKEYKREVDYYKKHVPNDNDRRTYRVWSECDADDMHYTMIEATFDGRSKNIVPYYAERLIIK